MKRHWVWTLGVMAAGWAVFAAHGDDWPQWRGPQRDGVWRERGLVDHFAESSLPPRWRVPIGSGYSGPSVAGGGVFVTDRVIEPRQQERVHCFDAMTGQKRWTHVYECVYRGVDYDAGPRASVLIEDDRAYALGAMGHLHCLDAANGTIRWKRDLNADFKIRMPIWGIAASPIVYRDLLICQIGGEPDACLVALDKMTGETRWTALPDPASYAAPILVRQAGQDVLVCYTGNRVVGLDPRTGKLYWAEPFTPARMVIGVATPVLHGDFLFMTEFFTGSLLLKLDQERLAATRVWQRGGEDEQNTDALHSIIATPIIFDGHVYGVDSYGELRCLKLDNGDRVWEDTTAVPRARWATIHLVPNGDRVWMFNERGELLIGVLSPQGFREIDRAKLIEPTLPQLRRRGGVCWAHPAFANRHVYVRNDEALVCASLAK